MVLTEKRDDRRAKPFVAAPRRTGARQPARLAVAATPRAVMAVHLRVYDPTLRYERVVRTTRPGESHSTPSGRSLNQGGAPSPPNTARRPAGSSRRGAQGRPEAPPCWPPQGAKDGPSFLCVSATRHAERARPATLRLAPRARPRTAHRRRTGFEAAHRTFSTNSAAPYAERPRKGLGCRANPVIDQRPRPPGWC